MKNILKFLLVLFNRLSIITLIFFLLLFTHVVIFASLVTDKNLVMTAIDRSNLYSNLPRDIIDALQNEANSQKSESIVRFLEGNGVISESDIKQAALSTVSPEYTKDQIQNNIENFYQFLNSQNESLAISIDIKQLQPQFQKELSTILYSKVIAFPECTTAQIYQLSQQPNDIVNIRCKPSFISDAEIESYINQYVNGFVTNSRVFDQIIDTQSFKISPENSNALRDAYNGLRLINWLFWAILVGLAIIIALTARPITKGLKIGGFAIIFSSLANLLWYLVVVRNYDFSKNIDINTGQVLSENSTQAISNITSTLLNSFAQSLVERAISYCLILIAMGAMMVFVGYLIHKILKQKSQDSSNIKSENNNPGVGPINSISSSANNFPVDNNPNKTEPPK